VGPSSTSSARPRPSDAAAVHGAAAGYPRSADFEMRTRWLFRAGEGMSQAGQLTSDTGSLPRMDAIDTTGHDSAVPAYRAEAAALSAQVVDELYPQPRKEVVMIQKKNPPPRCQRRHFDFLSVSRAVMIH